MIWLNAVCSTAIAVPTLCRDDAADIGVPGTLQATIAARVDRLSRPAKQFLYAAAVIGARFRPELLAALLDDTEGSEAIAELLQAELIDRVMVTPRAEYAFRHPLIRAVAYESQLKSGRAKLHRRLAVAIEQQDPGSADENAALIAEHLEAAGDLRAAFDWHMRAGGWLAIRDIRAARASWQRARQVADRLPADAPERTSMQIAPRTLLCGTVWRAGGNVADTGFDELRDLCTAADDKVSLAIAMAGYIMALTFYNRFREAAQVASELSDLLESIGDPTLTVALLFAAIYAKTEAGEMIEALRLADRLIDLADGDPTMGNLILGSPLSTAIAMRGHVKMCLGIQSWLDDAADLNRDGRSARLDELRFRPAVEVRCLHSIRGVGAGCDRDARDRRSAADRRANQRRFHSRNGPTQPWPRPG